MLIVYLYLVRIFLMYVRPCYALPLEDRDTLIYHGCVEVDEIN